MPIPEIAQTLGVAHVIEGSVRRDDKQLRITAQLVRAEDGFHVWSETFDRTSDDVFVVQSEIAEKVAAALDIVLDTDLMKKMRAAGVRDPQAFVAYQKGLELFEKAHASGRVLDDLAEANTYFEQDIERAPDLSDAYIQHSDYHSHILLYVGAGNRIDHMSDEDIAAAGKALLADFDGAVRYARDDRRRLNAELDQALFAGNWQGIAARLEKIFTERGCGTPNWFDVVALPYGNAEASRATILHEADCDPLDFGGYLHQVRMHAWLGEFDTLLNVSSSAFNATNNPLFPLGRIIAYLGLGQVDDAEALVQRGSLLGEMDFRASFYLAAFRGDFAQGRNILERYRREYGNSSPADLIHFHGLLGERENANRVAAAADANPFGHMVLASSILTCFCGAPFDLDATPNFARKIEASGLVWPPTKPAEWPLKSW